MVSHRTLIGVLISLIGNVLISLALNCQKLVHIRVEKEEKSTEEGQADQQHEGDDERQGLLENSGSRGYNATAGRLPQVSNNGTPHDAQNSDGDDNTQEQGMSTTFLRSKLWWLGISLMTLGEFGNFLSYGFAPASLVAPLGAVALLANVLISPIMLGERFYPSDIGGILLAIIGAVTVVFSSKQSDTTLDPDELMRAIKQKGFIAYVVIAIILAASLAWASTTRLGQRWILLDLGVCALLGGFTVLSTKGLSSLLSQGKPLELLHYPITYVMVVVLAGTALAQITYLNRALQRFDSREVIPTQFVMFTISAIVGSAILYRDFADMDAHQLINFLFGCLTTFAGVFLLTKQKQDEEAKEGGDADVEARGEGQSRSAGGDTPDRSAVVIASKSARPLPMGLRKSSRNARALTTGSVPTLLNVQDQHSGASLTLTPVSTSITSTSGSIPRYIITRRSIFNPAFPVSFVDSNRRLQRDTS